MPRPLTSRRGFLFALPALALARPGAPFTWSTADVNWGPWMVGPGKIGTVYIDGKAIDPSRWSHVDEPGVVAGHLYVDGKRWAGTWMLREHTPPGRAR